MAGDWVPFDHDFPEKPEVLALFVQTKTPIGEIMLRMHRFWRLLDRQTTDGHLPGCDLDGLAHVCGGDVAFWAAVQAQGWLGIAEDGHVFMPGFLERFSRPARERMLDAKRKRSGRRSGHEADAQPDTNRTETGRASGRQADAQPDTTRTRNRTKSGQDSDALARGRAPQPQPEPEPLSEPDSEPRTHLVGTVTVTGKDARAEDAPADGDEPGRDDQLWMSAKELAELGRKKLGGLPVRDPDDRSIVLKSAYLVAAGSMPEHWFADSIAAVVAAKPEKPWAYFTTCLKNRAKEAGENLMAMLAPVIVPADLVRPPPRSGRAEAASSNSKENPK